MPVYRPIIYSWLGGRLDKVGEQLPAVAITAASLTLVFLGFLFASWESYTTEAKKIVRPKFRLRAWIAFSGIICSLLAVLFGFIGLGTAHCYRWVDIAGVSLLAAWALLIVTQAAISLRDIG
jgi:hypothetical protein